MICTVRFCAAALAMWFTATIARAQLALPADATELPLTKALVIEGVGSWGRRAINLDAVAAKVASGELGHLGSAIPKVGDTIEAPAGVGGGGAKAWREVRASESGAFARPRQGSYGLFHVRSEKARVMLVEAAGHAMFYVNGEPRMGDPYGTGYVRLPVNLVEGDNVFIFAPSGRGEMRAKLTTPPAAVFVTPEDITAPDGEWGFKGDCLIGVPLFNATAEAQTCTLTMSGEGVAEGITSTVVHLPACSVQKVVVRFRAAFPDTGESVRPALKVETASGVYTSAPAAIVIRLTDRWSTRRITFESGIDGSVQYYSVVPHSGRGTPEIQPGLVLSLHGASVEATSQASSYKAKPSLVIACPTNRRPYGFDWEDWGRVDAMEVLRLAAAEYRTDPRRQYLTGHSMGGHGTWQIGVHYPERFAAIAPSAGWLAFSSYGGSARQGAGAEGSALEQVLTKAVASSDTPAMLERLRGKGIYILHGDADDNVPVAQARTAKELLTKLGIEHGYHEQPGAGHWWGDASSGAACLDWPGIFELFNAKTLDRPAADTLATELLDEHSMPRGTFKRAFARNFALVYATRGTAEENAWSLAKARYDAEQWWYRANGRAEVIADTQAVRLAGERNLILYGNAESNAAWSLVSPAAGVRVERTRVVMNGREWTGVDLGVLAVVGDTSGRGLIGIVAGTGVAGARSLDRLPYFLSGTGFPEQLVVRASVWREGMAGVEYAAMPTLP